MIDANSLTGGKSLFNLTSAIRAYITSALSGLGNNKIARNGGYVDTSLPIRNINTLHYLSFRMEFFTTFFIESTVLSRKITSGHLLLRIRFQIEYTQQCQKSIKMPLFAFLRNAVSKHQIVDDFRSHSVLRLGFRSTMPAVKEFGCRIRISNIIVYCLNILVGDAIIDIIRDIFIESHASNIIDGFIKSLWRFTKKGLLMN
nr:MAG TPA: hypothetical protein [Caudoviricetes sp.]